MRAAQIPPHVMRNARVEHGPDVLRNVSRRFREKLPCALRTTDAETKHLDSFDVATCFTTAN